MSLVQRWTFFCSKANLNIRARYPSGKGEVCKTFIREFDSHPRLQPLIPSKLIKIHNLSRCDFRYLSDCASSVLAFKWFRQSCERGCNRHVPGCPRTDQC